MVQFQLTCLATIVGIFVIFSEVSWGQPNQGGFGCLAYGTLRRNEETFEFRCQAVCHCEDGEISCLPMCPPFGMPPRCRTLKKVGDCCRLAHCANTTAKGACDTSLATPMPLQVQPPWLVNLNVRNASQSDHCVAVLVDLRTMIASPDCSANSNSRIIHPSKAISFSITGSSEMLLSEGNAYVTQMKISYSNKGDWGVEFLRELHEINIPYSEVCLRTDCALYIGAYSPVENKFQLILATHARPDQCQINESDLVKGIRCLEIRSQDYPDCTNLAGGVVSVRSDDHFFLKGFIAQSPFLRKESNGCDSQQQEFKRYYDFCSDFSNMTVNSQ